MSKKRIDLRKRKIQPKQQHHAMRPIDRCPVCQERWIEWTTDRKRGAKYHTFRQMVDWVIVGGESGPGCRPMDLNWARDIVTLCRDMSVDVFVKQLGGWPDKQGNPDQFPEDLQVREFPNGRLE